MRILLILTFLFSFTLSYSQSLPFDFESDITTTDFIDFDGGVATVIPNPQMNGINTSATVAQIVRDGGTIWSGSKISLAENLDFSSFNSITMKVFTTAPIGTVVNFKLEGNGTTERDVLTTVSNEWETLTWDFTGEPTNFKDVVFMFDFGNIGDGSENSTFLFDDVEQLFGGFQIDLPVDFESDDVNYTVTDFGGNMSWLGQDPEDENNHVIHVIKTDEAATWAGTTIGTPAGFATDIPLSLTESIMTVKVWSPEAGTPIRLKVEDSNDPTHTCETETNTTLDGAWEVLEFDFLNQAPGTELLSVGLDMGWTYNMASIFFNFGTEGSVAGEKTYYFDQVSFGDFVLSTPSIQEHSIHVFPNPTKNTWLIEVDNEVIQTLKVYNQNGQLLIEQSGPQNNMIIDATSFNTGIYFARIQTISGESVVKLLK